MPYALISGIVSAILYVIIGLKESNGVNAAIQADASYAKSLIFLVLPILLVVMMRRGWGLVSSLLLSNALAVVFSLLLGVVEPSVLFSDESPIVTGMTGMANIAIISFMIIMLLQIPGKSGALDSFASWIMTKCKTIRSAELVTYFLAMFGCIATHSSPNTIMFFGPFVRQLMNNYKDEADPCRSANILDGVACATNGLIPHGNPTLVIVGVATSVAGIPATFSFVNFLGYNFHCWGLLIIFLASILTGIGRKKKKATV